MKLLTLQGNSYLFFYKDDDQLAHETMHVKSQHETWLTVFIAKLCL